MSLDFHYGIAYGYQISAEEWKIVKDHISANLHDYLLDEEIFIYLDQWEEPKTYLLGKVLSRCSGEDKLVELKELRVSFEEEESIRRYYGMYFEPWIEDGYKKRPKFWLYSLVD